MLLGAAALLFAPVAARAACDHNPPKASMVDGQKVKCSGPFMMHAEDISNGYYDCKVLAGPNKGSSVQAKYNDCAQVNKGGAAGAAKASKAPTQKRSKGDPKHRPPHPPTDQ
jgi:hypothetical protein